jgi:hypothetical protein|nr:MAG TPA: hypothetical protein [Caudoviricetes sp.]
MTIDELIEKLKRLRDDEGGDTLVVVRGYESGYDRVDLIRTIDAYDSRARGGHEKWWEGRYDDSASFAGVEGTNPVHLVHLVSATDKVL